MKLFHGWVVVGAAFTVMLVGFGAAYSFGAFFHALESEFSATRAEVSLVFSISGFIYFTFGAPSGALADRFGPRWLVAVGMALVAGGLVASSLADELWQVYLGYGLSVGAGVGLSYVPSVGAVQRWFVRRRGLASGIAVSGIGVGTMIVPPLVGWLMTMGDWRFTYLVLGLAAAVLGIGAALLVSAAPERLGLAPDGGHATTSGAGAAPAPAWPGMALKGALATRPFWLLAIAALASSFGLFIPFAHMVVYARDHGLGEEVGVFLVSLIGGGSLAGRFLIGWLADVVGRRASYTATFAGMGVMMLWWLAAENLWMLVVFSTVFGACYGGFVALSATLVADYFGSRSVSGIIGTVYSAVGIGTLLGPTLAGVAYDLTGSYQVPILAGAVLNGVAATAVAALPNLIDWHARVRA